MTGFEQILSKFDIRKKLGDNSFQAICPAHSDTVASLSITEVDDKILIYCHAGCKIEDILKKIGLKKSDLYLDNNSNKYQHTQYQYDYYDLDGNIVHSTIKYYIGGKKKFYQVSYSNGKKVKKLQNIRTVLYNLPNVRKSIEAGERIFIVEGEKDADTLIKYGLTATTNPMGAGNWKNYYSDYLVGADIIVIPDNDEPGKKHAEQVVKSLKGKANSIKFIILPGLEYSQDVTDWLNKGHEIDELEKIIETTEFYYHSNNESNIILDDMWLSKEFVEKYTNIRYNHTIKRWYIWNGNIWRIDEKKEINEFAKELITHKINEFRNKSKIFRKLSNISKQTLIDNILKLAQSVQKISVTNEDFDKYHYILAFNNGYYDLGNHIFFPPDPNLMITQKINCDYDENAKCDEWEKFINYITIGDEKFAEFIQALVGYSLQGKVTEEIMVFLYGTGSNGKSIFFQVLNIIFGDYYQKVPINGILLKNSDKISNDIARLEGKRPVVVGEWPAETKINEAKLKELTGGDRLTARYLYQEYKEFTPSHTLWMYGNHKPIITGNDDGIWRRVILIHLKAKIGADMRKKRDDVISLFEAEKSGIINWAIEGFKKYQKDGLKYPEAVKTANALYKEESNVLGEFIKQECETGDYITKGIDIYRAYESWAMKNYQEKINTNQFYKLLTEMGYEKTKLKQGNYCAFKGIRVKSENSEENDISSENGN